MSIFRKIDFLLILEKVKSKRHITSGMFYCRDSAGFSVSASNKLSCNLTGQCFEVGNKNIPPNRCGAFTKMEISFLMLNILTYEV